MGTFVTVSRSWNNPEITIKITGDGIYLSMDMEDFKKALKKEITEDFKKTLKQEIGSVKFVFKQTTFSDIVDKAVANVIDSDIIDKAVMNIIEGIKEESIKVAQYIKK